MTIATLSLTLLSSCSALPEKQVVVQTEYVSKNIPVQERPKPVKMPDVEWFVVTKDNMAEFEQRVSQAAGDIVFMAITPKGYENLAIGIQDLRRYVLQQNEIIAYYEKQVTEEPVNPTPEQD